MNFCYSLLLICLFQLFFHQISAQCKDQKGNVVCCYPGTCTSPKLPYSNVMNVPSRKQWYYSGGFCGALSVQSIALSYGVWISQLIIRQNALPGGGHGDAQDGYEILHTNIESSLNNLSFTYNSWNYQATAQPQSGAYLNWLKKELVAGNPVVWFIMCSGDGHNTYGLANYDHVEPVFGIYSNHPLSDLTVYGDDVLVHGSDWDLYRYYRPFNSLVDSAFKGNKLTENCSLAGTVGGGPNEAYPCLMNMTDYGWSIKGLVDPLNRLVPTSLSIIGDGGYEPNTNKPVKGFVQVNGPLVIGANYTTFRWNGIKSFPRNSQFENSRYSDKIDTNSLRWNFMAKESIYSFIDHNIINSDSAVYYGTVRSQ